MAKKPKVLKVQNGGCFDDLNIREDDVEVASSKEQKLDIFRLLTEADRKNYGFYDSLTEKEKKGFAPVVAIRWMSSTTGDHDFSHHFHVLNVNDFVNQDFWSLTGHPELQYKLMCMSGSGQQRRHQWIPGIKKTKKKSKVDTFLRKFYPKLNELELTIYKKSMTNEDYENLVRSFGYQEKEVKSYLKDWKDEKKKGF